MEVFEMAKRRIPMPPPTRAVPMKKKAKLNKQKNEEIEAVKNNIEKVKEIDAALLEILNQTIAIREELNKSYIDCVVMHNADYLSFNDEQKMKLGALVNNTKSLSAMFEKTLQ